MSKTRLHRPTYIPSRQPEAHMLDAIRSTLSGRLARTVLWAAISNSPQWRRASINNCCTRRCGASRLLCRAATICTNSWDS